jgi:hypothetical protein
MKKSEVLMYKVLAFFSFLSVAIAPAMAQERPVLAVFDLEDRGTDLVAQERDNLTQLIMVKLAECGYQVIPREQIRERIREQQKESYRTCYDESCQIELGRELAAQKSLSSQLMKIGAGCQLGATIFDLKKAAADGAASASGGCDKEQLLGLIGQVAEKLCQPLREAAQKAAAQVLSSYEKILGDAAALKEESARWQKVWQEVAALAADESLPRTARAEMVKRYLAEAGPDNPLRPHAEKLLENLVWGQVQIKTAPQGAAVTIDGKPAGAAPLTMELPPGKHLVTASARDHRPREMEALIESGKSSELVIELERIFPMNPYKKWGHVAFWSGLGVAAVGVVTYLKAVDYADQNVHGHPEMADDARLFRDISFGLWAGGGALLATGAVLWLLSPGDRNWFEKHQVSLLPLKWGVAICADWRW